MHAYYTDSKTKQNCAGCGNLTRGLLLAKRDESPFPLSIPLCPKCRDTKSKLADLSLRFHVDLPSEIFRNEVTEFTPEFHLYRPQKGISIHNLKANRMKQILNSPKWVEEPKIDGARLLLYIHKNKIRLFSSRISKRTGTYSERTAHFPHITDFEIENINDTVLDCEGIIDKKGFKTQSGPTDSTLNATVACMNADPKISVRLQEKNHAWLKLITFDCLKYCGVDYRDSSLKQRRELAKSAVESISSSHVTFIDSMTLNRFHDEFSSEEERKQAVFEDSIAQGYEGLMLKNLGSLYYAPSVGARSKGMVKWKKMETHDGFITGYIPGRAGYKGLVGALKISGYTQYKQIFEFAAVSNIPLHQRKEISAPDGSLKQEYYAKVVEIRAQKKTRTNRLRHAVILRWRTDKTPKECFYPL